MRTVETCIVSGPLGCKLSLSHQEKHNGGGPFFIENFLSKPGILDKFNATTSVMEMCSGPGFMGYYLAYKLNLKNAYFLDINPDLADCYKENKKRVDFKVSFKASDGFKAYTEPKVNLIVLNPPHVVEEKQFQNISNTVPAWFPTDTPEQEKQSRLILLDKDFKFHTHFCSEAYDRLTKNGQIAFLENEKFIPHKRLEEHLGDRFSYEFIQFQDTLDEGYYLLLATKK